MSLRTLSEQIHRTIRRFPVVSALAFITTGLCIYNMEASHHAYTTFSDIENLIAVCMLGLPVLLAVALVGERWRWTVAQRAAASLLSILFLGAYFWLLPEGLFENPQYHFVRYDLFLLCACLAVIVAPFVMKGHENDFWSFNRQLFQGFAISGIFSGTLFVGLVAAMYSVSYLFDVNIDDRFYGELWFLVAGVVAIHIFLSRIPASFTVQKNEKWYPAVVRIFAQYILVPLVALYTFILIVYATKILATGVWPKGQVCYMVLGYAAAGMLADVLLFPSRTEKQFRWVTIAGKVYFALLALFCFLLYGAIWQRIAQYGITENRYFVVLLGTWTLGMAVYFLWHKKHSIRLIPITLFAVLLLSSFGPWSAFNVGKQSQLYRFETALQKNNFLQNGVIVAPTDSLSLEDRRVISDVTDYLYQAHGIESLQSYFSFDVEALHKTLQSEAYFYDYEFTRLLLKEAGITHSDEFSRHITDTSNNGSESFHYEIDAQSAMNIAGYRLFIPLTAPHYYGNAGQIQTFAVGSETYSVSDPDSATASLTVSLNGAAVATFDLRSHLEKLRPTYNASNARIPAADMTLRDGEWALILRDISYYQQDGTITDIGLTGWLLRR